MCVDELNNSTPINDIPATNATVSPAKYPTAPIAVMANTNSCRPDVQPQTQIPSVMSAAIKVARLRTKASVLSSNWDNSTRIR